MFMPDVRFGSLADMCSAKGHVRFTPESGHVQRNLGCPLSANSGHHLDLVTTSIWGHAVDSRSGEPGERSRVATYHHK